MISNRYWPQNIVNIALNSNKTEKSSKNNSLVNEEDDDIENNIEIDEDDNDSSSNYASDDTSRKTSNMCQGKMNFY